MPVVVVDSGKLVSSAFVVRGDRPFTVHCPSQSTGYALFAEFLQVSATSPWDRLAKTDGSGASYVVVSGAGNMVDVVEFPATNFARVTSGPSSRMSFAVNELNRT